MEEIVREQFSYSKIDCYKQCKFKYKIKYIDKHYISGSSIALEYGTLVHGIEEEIANKIKNNEVIDYVELKTKFLISALDIEKKFPEDYNSEDKSGRTYRDKTYFYLRTGIYRLENYIKSHDGFEIVGAEIEFKVDYDPIHFFYGKIDRLIYDNINNKYIIHDIKTYSVPMESKDLATPLQMVVYTMAIKTMYNVDESQIICEYDLPLCDIIQRGGSNGYMNRGKNKLDQLFTGIIDDDFTPTPTPLCAWCEYSTTNKNATDEGKLLCPYHSNWTREHKNFSVANSWEGMENHTRIFEEYQRNNMKGTDNNGKPEPSI